MAAESEAVVERRGIREEVMGTLEQWLDDYTSPWADGYQRKIIVWSTDYENGYFDVECAKVEDHGQVRNKRRYRITIDVKRIKDA